MVALLEALSLALPCPLRTLAGHSCSRRPGVAPIPSTVPTACTGGALYWWRGWGRDWLHPDVVHNSPSGDLGTCNTPRDFLHPLPMARLEEEPSLLVASALLAAAASPQAEAQLTAPAAATSVLAEAPLVVARLLLATSVLLAAAASASSEAPYAALALLVAEAASSAAVMAEVALAPLVAATSASSAAAQVEVL